MKKLPKQVFVAWDSDDEYLEITDDPEVVVEDFDNNESVGVYELRGMKKVKRTVSLEDA